MSQFLVADVPVGETLHRIAVLACDATPPSMAAGLTLLDRAEKPTTSIFTDELAANVDKGQSEEGAGPCLEAFQQGRTVKVDDTGKEEGRWPAFVESALSYGVLSTLSAPIASATGTVGALNLYAPGEEAYSNQDEEDLTDFATQVAVVVANSLSYWCAFELADGLRQALRTRETIGLAKGLIMATNNCSADEAFTILVRASQRENVTLRDIAARTVEQRHPQSG